ncbi:MAG: DUF4159 domain-containing protein [Gammaproteobacteria bacterium]|nr:DUF4159 domain-containing protein [Gammaproteobacteria bacterium]
MSSHFHPLSVLTRFLLACSLVAWHSFAHAQREFRVYQSFEGEDGESALPADWNVPAGFVVGRLMYPSTVGFGFFRRGGDWRRGGTSWSVDYPKGDRALITALRRYIRADVRAVEQPVNPEDGDDIFNWPYLTVGLAGYWQLDDEFAAKLREYLLRGGFLFCDSFFDSRSWIGFERGMKQIFPDRRIVDLTDDEVVFHSFFDLPGMTQVQIPNMNALYYGNGYLGDGAVPHWRGIFDDEGRLMVLIAFNNDVSDAWQWADEPSYPADKANLGLRIGVNIVLYTLTH